MKNGTQRTHRNVSFLVVSAVLHILLFFFIAVKNNLFSSTEISSKNRNQPSVQFIDIADMDKYSNKELVEQAEKEKATKPPKDSKFLSQVDKSVEKETAAINRGKFQNENSKPTPPQNPVAEKTETAEPKEAEAAKIETPEMKAFAHGDVPMFAKKEKKTGKAKSIQDLQANSMAQLSQQAFADVSRTNDHLKDVVAGAETHLNTREFIYYTYFNRIKQKLRQHWEPILHQKVRDMNRKGREIASNSTTTTSLIITLDAQGTLVRVQIQTSAGMEDLDSAAIEALKVAAPFPNPPKALVVNGIIEIPWDFVLES